MEADQEPFLPLKEKTFESPNARNGSSRRRITALSICLHTTIFILYTCISVAILKATQPIDLRPIPAIDGLVRKYTPTIFHNLTSNPYAGYPTDEIDNAWNALLAPMHIRVTEAELRRDHQASVELPERGGYLIWMGVFHELHCIRMLQQWIYRKHYHPTLTLAEEEHMMSHVDHCLEMLRQTAVCHADASLTTFTWHSAKQRPMFNASESEHTCIDWMVFLASFSDRVVEEDEIRRLNNPLTGKVFCLDLTSVGRRIGCGT